MGGPVGGGAAHGLTGGIEVAPDLLPAVFTAHGNPLNALPGTPFAGFLAGWGQRLPRPKAILCVSAHWEAPGLFVTASERPRTIHDFWGFPEELYRLRYPAPGAPALAARAAGLLGAASLPCGLDPGRGLDHGAWAPLRHLFPGADVPVIEVSLPDLPLPRLADVGRALAPLRGEGVLLLGSGNLVHNLGLADFPHREAPVPGWASAFDVWVRDRLEAWDLEALARPWESGPQGRLAHPSLEHYAPLLVVCGAAGERPSVRFRCEAVEHGTVGMRCLELQ